MIDASKGIFVTGTDTEIGKTVVTGWLARQWRDAGMDVITQKLVQTGSANVAGTGNALDNVLVGNSGANLLKGEGGLDSEEGAQGGHAGAGQRPPQRRHRQRDEHVGQGRDDRVRQRPLHR